MSALGMYKVCKEICLCGRCKLNGTKCCPCMDCDGLSSELTHEDFTNGYTDKCKCFKK
ncbi:hypothetical protein [Clostridium senegalense]